MKPLPCPFCAQDPIVEHDYYDHRARSKTYWVRCEECGFSLEDFTDRDSAIAYWNRREGKS